MSNAPRDHHYTPQFYLRNFAIDPDQRKITTVAKHGHVAVWRKRSIKSIGYERDLYIHSHFGVPVSVETTISKRIETPISQSDTWAKITSGRTDALNLTDKPILYSLIRHLEVRTPHYLAGMRELERLAFDPNSGMQFSAEERLHYAMQRAMTGATEAQFNAMSASLAWTEDTYRGAGLSIHRSPIPLRTTTTPVLVVPAPHHPAPNLPLPGLIPVSYFVSLNRYTLASLTLGAFDGDAFMNTEIDATVARGINRRYAAQFAYFDNVRHLIADSGDELMADMTWAPYDVIEQDERTIRFRRRDGE